MTAGGPGQLLFEFVRYWSHRAAGDSTIARQGRLVMFTEAVNSLVQRGRKATVNAVAHELGIDQSGASRLLSDAHSAGYVRTTRDPQDQRRRNITITQAGFTALGEARAWQEEVFAFCFFFKYDIFRHKIIILGLCLFLTFISYFFCL